MLDAINATGPEASMYFTCVTLVGTYILLNLLVAVLLKVFDEHNLEESRMADIEAVKESGLMQLAKTRISAGRTPGSHDKFHPARGWKRAKTSNLKLTGLAAVFHAVQQKSGYDQLTEEEDIETGQGRGEGLALGCFLPEREPRATCLWLSSQTWFDVLVMLAVTTSSLLLTLDSPRLDPDSPLASTLRLTDGLLALVFLFEASVKIIANGFAYLPNAYLRNAWNVLDFVILLITVGAAAAEFLPQLVFLVPLRSLRVLRPLRLLTRNAGVKLVLSSLFEALPAVSNVVGVIIMFQVLFAIIGMQVREACARSHARRLGCAVC